MNTHLLSTHQPYEYMAASGDISYPITNDYIFRIIFQENNKMILDFEMQVIDYHDWPLRSISYLSRDYDSLCHGEDYSDIMPVRQFAFLCYSVFPDRPKFYATYRIMDEEDHRLFSDSFAISVVELAQAEHADEKDKKYEIDSWAKLFRAKKWEDVQMITKGNNALSSAAESLYQANADYNVIKIAREREDYLRREAAREKRLNKQESEIAEKDSLIAEKDSVIAEKDSVIAEKDNQITRYEALLKANGIDPYQSQ